MEAVQGKDDSLDPAQGPTTLVVNAGSDSGGDADRVVRALRAHGVSLDDVHVLEDVKAIHRVIEEAARRDRGRVLVGSGDGTMSLAADLLAGTNVALGVVPLGTANDFARNMGLPRDLQSACAVLAAGRRRRVAVGRANGRVFVNALSFGLTSRVTQRLSMRLKRTAGPMAYPAAAALEVARPKPFALTVRVDDGPEERWQALQVVVGNGRFQGGGTCVSPDAAVDAPKLDAYVLTGSAHDVRGRRPRDVARLLRFAVRLKRGRHLHDPAVRSWTCRRIELSADPVQEVGMDGELLLQTPVRCEVWPDVLNVCVR